MFQIKNKLIKKINLVIKVSIQAGREVALISVMFKIISLMKIVLVDYLVFSFDLNLKQVLKKFILLIRFLTLTVIFVSILANKKLKNIFSVIVWQEIESNI